MNRLNIVAIASFLLLCCQSNSGSDSAKEVGKKEYSTAYQLATLEKGEYVAEDDISVKRFENLLQQLAAKYDDKEQSIANKAFKIKNLAVEKGVNLSMIQLMEGAVQVRNQKLDQYLANYLILREKGYSHQRTLDNL